MSWLNPFKKTDDPLRAVQRDQIVLWIRALVATEVVKVNEIECNDPQCPGIETVVLLISKSTPTQAVKIRKPLTEVTEQDVQAALSSFLR
jgi:hypothetical protein